MGKSSRRARSAHSDVNGRYVFSVRGGEVIHTTPVQNLERIFQDAARHGPVTALGKRHPLLQCKRACRAKIGDCLQQRVSIERFGEHHLGAQSLGDSQAVHSR